MSGIMQPQPKESDLMKFKEEIQRELEVEIAKRYYWQKGEIEATFDHDEDILTAIDVLRNGTRYDELLAKR